MEEPKLLPNSLCSAELFRDDLRMHFLLKFKDYFLAVHLHKSSVRIWTNSSINT